MKNQYYPQSIPQEEKKIKTDFVLLLNLLKELLIFLITLPFYLIAIIIFSITLKWQKANYYLEKIIFIPIKIIKEITKWFFQAKITASLILILIVMFFLQFIFLMPYLNNLMMHPSHLFNIQIYSAITSIFLHADLSHLLSNCLALLIFGRIVEKQFKSLMLWIFLGSGLISNIFSTYISYLQNDIFYSLGASGAIAGLIIFAILIEPFALTSILILPIPIFIIGWTLILMDITGLTNPSQINHLAHLGGYGSILLILFFLEVKHRKKIITGFLINIAMILLLYLITRYTTILQIIGL